MRSLLSHPDLVRAPPATPAVTHTGAVKFLLSHKEPVKAPPVARTITHRNAVKAPSPQHDPKVP